MAGLHTHHDHSQGYVDIGCGRCAEEVICDQCNSADGLAKRRLGLPAEFSLSTEEIRQFVIPEPHGRHRIDLERARCVSMPSMSYEEKKAVQYQRLHNQQNS
jgi:hypothetical protein